jgi:glucokinase-like ROK family protein
MDDVVDALVMILNEVRSGGSRSRSELVTRTGLTRGVVAQRVGELIDLGLVVESEVGPSTGGRPPRRVTFRAEAGHLLVADLGATSIDVAVTDLDGRILGHRDEPADVSAGPERSLSRIEELFDQLTDATRDLPGHLWGVGVGVPGPVEFRSGRPVSPPIMPGWDGYPVRERFAERYGAPVWVDNDVNILALGEWRSGIAVGHDNVVVVKIGTGIGAGIISNGRIHRGAQGAAGDVGHIQVVDAASVLCRCGNVGCLEALAGGAALARDGEGLASSGRSERLRIALEQHGRVTAEDVARAASFGDPLAVSLLQVAGHRVGLMLASVVNFFNPSLIVVGGGVAQSGDQLLAAIRETVYRRSLPLATRDLVVQRSSLGALAGVIGASTMVLEQLFSRDSLARWLAERRPAADLSA